jgi:hypothetical protein
MLLLLLFVRASDAHLRTDAYVRADAALGELSRREARSSCRSVYG